jgi:hypothetical protein
MDTLTFLGLLVLASTVGYAVAARQAHDMLLALWETNRQLMHRNVIDDGLQDLLLEANEEWPDAISLEEYDATHCLAPLGAEFVDDEGEWLCRLPHGHGGAHLP